MLTIEDQRPFLPTRDFSRSIDFYNRMGWRTAFLDDNLALMELGHSRLFLQKYYQPEWAANMMLHLVVDDVDAWYKHAMKVKAEGGFDEVRVSAPKHEPYGAMVAHIVDPAGVLFHIAQFD